jgi:3-oxoacyl-[acyl-carrier protein] reductase
VGRFDGRLAVVTGSARGIGFDTAARLAEEGAYPEDIAAAIALLCSDEASLSTGQTLYVDGRATL